MSYPINPRSLKKTELRMAGWFIKELQKQVSIEIDKEIFAKLKSMT